MDLALVMIKSDGTHRRFPVRKSRIVIGRTNECDLRIPLPSVSRQHCEILVADDGIGLKDLGSSNGTFHNDTRVQEASLSAGDRIGVGPVSFTLLVDGQPALPSLGDGSGDAGEAPRPSASSPQVEEADPGSMTVDVDDPIAALEAMGNAEDVDLDLPISLDDEEETR